MAPSFSVIILPTPPLWASFSMILEQAIFLFISAKTQYS